MNVSIISPTRTMLNVLRAIEVAKSDASIVISKEGISFSGAGAAKIDLIQLNLPASDFPKKFEVDEVVKFGVKTDEIIKIVKRFGDGKKIEDEVELTIDPEGKVTFKSAKKNFGTHTVGAKEGEEKIPQIPFTTKIVVNRDSFKEALEDIQLQAERVRIDVAGGILTLSGKGDMGRNATSNVSFIKLEGPDAKGTYNLETIFNFVDKIDEAEVTISLADSLPIKLTMGKINYFIAPLVNQ